MTSEPYVLYKNREINYMPSILKRLIRLFLLILPFLSCFLRHLLRGSRALQLPAARYKSLGGAWPARHGSFAAWSA